MCLKHEHVNNIFIGFMQFFVYSEDDQQAKTLVKEADI